MYGALQVMRVTLVAANGREVTRLVSARTDEQASKRALAHIGVDGRENPNAGWRVRLVLPA